MRIDLPQCNFKTCIYSFDGNCTNKNRYETCEYQLDKAEIEKCHKEFEELNIIEEEERKEALENARKSSVLFKNMVDYAIAEAIKEFAERLKREIDMICYETAFEHEDTILTIDNLTKEMMEGNNG